MSRIGKLAIKVPDKVKLASEGQLLRVEGPKGKMQLRLAEGMSVDMKPGEVLVKRPGDNRQARSLHGLTRTLINNAVKGVVSGYERSLDINGVGFKAEGKGREIVFSVGFSHPVVFKLPEGIQADVDPKQTRVTLKGVDKHLVGLTAAQVRSIRPPEPYKGKGIKYAEETIRRKEGKTGAA